MSVDDGGSQIIVYELYRNQGGTDTNYVKVDSYLGKQRSHTLTQSVDGILPSTIYKLRQLAVNAYGSSELSEETDVGVSSFPAKPNQVRKIDLESTSTAITVEWDASLDTELPVIGYKLLVNNGMEFDYYTQYNGVNFPNVRKYELSGLQSGDKYSFKVQAINFNGVGEAIDPATHIICK